MKASLIEWFAAQLIRLICFFLSRSVRWQYVGHRYDSNQSPRLLLSFWHARGLMMPYAFRGWHGYVLMSEHRDGGFISDAVNLMGIKTIRGSSTRGGAKALLQMIRKSEQEQCGLGITPDGPKGPRELVKAGVVQLAIKSKLPILPVCYATDRYWRVNSWDEFYIPKPFSRGVFVFGDYIYLDSDEALETAMERVQMAMNATQQQADQYF